MKGSPTQGNATLAAVGTTDIIATPGATARLVIKKIHVSVSVAIASSFVEITDGTTTYHKWSTATLIYPPTIDFGEQGFPLPLNKALVLEVVGDDSTVHATAIAEVRGV